MQDSRVFVFKEIQKLDQVMYQWFKLAEDEEHIIPDVILSAQEHWALVNAD